MSEPYDIEVVFIDGDRQNFTGVIRHSSEYGYLWLDFRDGTFDELEYVVKVHVIKRSANCLDDTHPD